MQRPVHTVVEKYFKKPLDNRITFWYYNSRENDSLIT